MTINVQTVANILIIKFRHNLYKLKGGRSMSCQTLTKVVSNLFYSKRFSPYFVEAIIVFLDCENIYYKCTQVFVERKQCDLLSVSTVFNSTQQHVCYRVHLIGVLTCIICLSFILQDR